MLRILIPILLGVFVGLSHISWLLLVAQFISDLFIRGLKFVSLPLISLSILATVSGFTERKTFFQLGKKVVSNTLLTTVLSAFVALLVYEFIQPAHVVQVSKHVVKEGSYIAELVKIFPDNIVRPFLEGHVVGIVIVAILLAIGTLSLPQENRAILHSGFQSLFMLFMKITQWIVKIMPLAVFGFVATFVASPQESFSEFALYLTAIFMTNGIHAFIILPAFLKVHGISPLRIAKGMWPALYIAFFSKSSAATMPIAIEVAEKNLNISPTIARFSFPLCTTINMNACAAFMLITVFFIAQSHGVCFSFIDKIMWVGIVTVAAVGNAGVPMGCYFLASALLASLNVPLNLMGAILPFYAIIDMFETAINIWSDSCVTVVADSNWSKINIRKSL